LFGVGQQEKEMFDNTFEKRELCRKALIAGIARGAENIS